MWRVNKSPGQQANPKNSKQLTGQCLLALAKRTHACGKVVHIFYDVERTLAGRNFRFTADAQIHRDKLLRRKKSLWG